MESTQDMVKSGKSDFRDSQNESGTRSSLNPVDADDLAILNGTSKNNLAPPASMRFNLEGPRPNCFVNILSLITSSCTIKREISPVQMCPQFSLVATLLDSESLKELDGLFLSPLFLPDSECTGIEFSDELSSSQQWVATASYYFVSKPNIL